MEINVPADEVSKWQSSILTIVLPDRTVLKSSGMNHLEPVFFFHVPKAGGSSVLSALRERFRGDVWGIEDVRPEPLKFRLQKEAIGDHPVRVAHAHISPADVPLDLPYKRAVLLRDPSSRLISHFCYCYQHRHRLGDHHRFFLRNPKSAGRSFALRTLVEWVEEFRLEDYQSRFMAGHLDRAVSSDTVACAIRNLEAMDAVGITSGLPLFLRQMEILTGVQGVRTLHVNQSNRSVLDLDDGAMRFVTNRFLTADAEVFASAEKQALKTWDRLRDFASQTDWLAPHRAARIEKRLKRKTLGELLRKVQCRILPLFRRAEDRALIMLRTIASYQAKP